MVINQGNVFLAVVDLVQICLQKGNIVGKFQEVSFVGVIGGGDLLLELFGYLLWREHSIAFVMLVVLLLDVIFDLQLM